MRLLLTRRDFLARAACSGALLSMATPQARRAAPGRMYVSLNSSLTRQMPWPDFVRLAARLGYGGVDVSLNPAKAAGVEATRALLADLKLEPAVTGLPMQFAMPDEAAFQDGLKLLDENAAFAAAIGCTG